MFTILSKAALSQKPEIRNIRTFRTKNSSTGLASSLQVCRQVKRQRVGMQYWDIIYSGGSVWIMRGLGYGMHDGHDARDVHKRVNLMINTPALGVGGNHTRKSSAICSPAQKCYLL